MQAFIRICVLIVAAIAFSSSIHAEETGRRVVTTENSDYFGFDLRTEQDVTLAECEKVCIGDASCRAFTYNPKVKWCFLKSDYNKINSFNGAIAGKIVQTNMSQPDIGAPPVLPFLTQQQLDDARTAKARLALEPDQEGLGLNGLVAVAYRELAAGNVAPALKAFQGALAIAPDDGALWVEAARAANRVYGNTSFAVQASLAAINGYQLTRSTQSRADALAVLAKALENSENFRASLSAYKSSLALVEAKSVRESYMMLRNRQGFRVTEHKIDSDSAIPRVCVQFSEPLVKAGVDYTPFVTLDGATPKALEAKGSEICVEGLSHGERYKIALRPGLPSSIADEALEAPLNLDVYIPDRAAFVRFTGDSFVLPGTARRGIPIVSVNTTSANLKLYRVGDRNIASLLTASQFLTQLDGYSAQRIQDESGEMVWQGTIDIATDINKEVVTSFPVDEALPQRKPGVYVLTAVSATAASNEWDAQATQWFVVSDIGLSTYSGTDGLSVFARSLATARPMNGVKLDLLAKNNEILGTATTDADGRASFDAGLLRGTAAMSAAVITAQGSNDDYVFLDLTRAGFDLSDRGVTGRAAPGAIDVLTWTERGIYRVGETVHVSALARDSASVAIDTLPLTFVFMRPDGVEDRRVVNNGGQAGGYTLDFDLQPNAMRGTWTVQIYTDPKGTAISEKQFQVDDFVPDRIEFDLASAVKEIEVGQPAPVTIEGRFLYGAPAAGLELEGEVSLKPSRDNANFKGYAFGLSDEEATEESRTPLEALEPLDVDGKATFDVNLSDMPSTTQLLNATITVRVQEAGGRAVERSLVLPVKQDGEMIGIKPQFSGELGENAVGRFHVIAVDQNGSKLAKTGLIWKLLRVEQDYQWYRDGTSWKYEPVISTKQVSTGRLDLTTDGGEISLSAGWGRYRLEVETADPDGPTSSVEFDSGWYVAASSTETPDGLEIALDKEHYAVGDTAKLRISPRFAGEALITIGSEKLVATRTATIAAGGGEIDIPVTGDFGAGAYVTATLYRPGDAQESRLPMRSIGVKWLAVDPADRKLSVKLDVPEKTLPRQTLNIPVEVAGAGVGEEAYVTVAAVDVGILNLTRYTVPDPDGWYFGQRQLGLEIRDIYGRLIDGSLGATGRLRTGGDGGQMPLQGNPPKEKLVAFFSGPVELDASGKAIISFDIPQFNGTARVMAVAWSKTGVGHASADVVIRDPVVVTASLPQFLAPGDKAELRLDIANTDSPAGELNLKVSSDSSLVIDAEKATQTFTVKPGGKFDVTLPISGIHPGAGAVFIELTSADGLSLLQSVFVPVRPAALPVTTRHPVVIEPNASLRIDSELLAESMLQGSAVSVSVTRSAAFDVPALLTSLERYPYGCAEQTTSRALPLLYLSELAKQSGLPDEPDVQKRVQEAIYRVLSYQSSTGSFGLWSPGSGDLWLDAYVSDFLTRAREQKYQVPDQAMIQALDNLQNALSYDVDVKTQGNEIAYALYVLARNRKAAISDLRYYADTKLADFPTPLSKGHLAAALALYGDAPRSGTIFGEALQMASDAKLNSLDRSDYGSPLRDNAAVLTLAAESRPVPAIIPQMSKIVAKDWEQASYTSTQEQMWTLLAARAVGQGDEGIRLSINGTARSGGYAARLTGDEVLDQPMTIANTSADPVTAVVTTVAAPAFPLPAGGNGFSIQRTYYTLDGQEANVTEARQNERYVVVINATESNSWPSRVLITDLLPAGFEIDNPSLVDSAKLTNFEWIGDIEAAHTEFRSDRFVAAFDRSAGDNRSITFAYVVRAVTPGTYDHPAANIEDMYRPQFSARTATGRMEVRAVE
ncbi:alpha-2-macroglobulin family protein [Pararhizobium gei]|uniref:alpha-2-macroglobulin family protein n=1 Tax=Pararhizobium gei TaxID=1395951 RepID=UPI0023DC11FF|nr:alpha-2-macroglobulin family protein [Rhizobium gei]